MRNELYETCKRENEEELRDSPSRMQATILPWNSGTSGPGLRGNSQPEGFLCYSCVTVIHISGRLTAFPSLGPI